MVIRFIPKPELLDSPRFRKGFYSAQNGIAGGAPPAGRTSVAIIGGGPAALSVATALWHRGITEFTVLDRLGGTCTQFLDRTNVLRQNVLRSPYEHHMGTEGAGDCELIDFARLHWDLLSDTERKEVRMAQYGHRSVVPLDIFEGYCAYTASLHGVPERTVRANVSAIHRASSSGLELLTDTGSIAADFVVCALGEGPRSAPAEWNVDPTNPRIQSWEKYNGDLGTHPVVIGAGLSAAHIISDQLRHGRDVTWVMRRAERYQCADVNAAFFRAEGRGGFSASTWADRQSIMQAQRTASIMFEFRPLLLEAESSGQLSVHRDARITQVSSEVEGIRVELANGAGSLRGSGVALALGTVPISPSTVLGSSFSIADDGWPSLSDQLEFEDHRNVFAVGALTCMVLGPAARNIDGHRVAAERVADAILSRTSTHEVMA